MIASIHLLPHAVGKPRYETPGAAGCDLQAAVTEPVVLEPGKPTLIPTGIKVALPAGYEMQIRSRSGMTLKSIIVANSPGTIDADFRGELKVILVNAGDAPFTVHRGMRIAQGVMARVQQITWRETDTLPRTARGEGAFGSTGSM